MRPERWIVNICPLCRHQDNAHVGDCPNRDKVFAYEQVVVAPELDRLAAASNAEGWKSRCEDYRAALAEWGCGEEGGYHRGDMVQAEECPGCRAMDNR